MDIALVLEMAARAAPERIAVTDVRGMSVSCADLARASGVAAVRFVESDVARVGYLGTNGVGLPITLFGASMSDRPFVPLNYRLSDSQLADTLQQCGDMLVVANETERARLDRLGFDATIAAESLESIDESVESDRAFDPVDPDHPAVLLHTSGTTATPKAAVLRHRHLAAYIISTVEFAAADRTDAALVSVPPYHIAGISTILSNLYLGRRIVYLDPFDPARWLDVVRDQGVTHAMLVPTMLARIIERLDGDDAHDADVPTLRTLAYGGAPMPRPVIERALRCFGNVGFTNAYGLTETSSTITVLGPEDHRSALADEQPRAAARLGSAGRPVPGIELAVVDDHGGPCPPGAVGHVLVRGEQVSGEYDGRPIDLEDGWFRTRDRGWLDEDGYLFIQGRVDDTIIRGGENIAPAEIEAVLIQHPAVAQCGVVGLDDPDWGQCIGAVVVLEREGVTTPGDLRDWLRERLRSSKTPDVIEIHEALPYTESGKLLRRVLRESLQGNPADARARAI